MGDFTMHHAIRTESTAASEFAFRSNSAQPSLPMNSRTVVTPSPLAGYRPISASLARRRFLFNLAVGTAFFATPGAFAEELIRTPKQTEGPFYPDKLPLDTDNDLIVVNDGLTPAIGEITYLSGKVL